MDTSSNLCKNCGETTSGKYCINCGQEAKTGASIDIILYMRYSILFFM